MPKKHQKKEQAGCSFSSNNKRTIIVETTLQINLQQKLNRAVINQLHKFYRQILRINNKYLVRQAQIKKQQELKQKTKKTEGQQPQKLINNLLSSSIILKTKKKIVSMNPIQKQILKQITIKILQQQQKFQVTTSNKDQVMILKSVQEEKIVKTYINNLQIKKQYKMIKLYKKQINNNKLHTQKIIYSRMKILESFKKKNFKIRNKYNLKTIKQAKKKKINMKMMNLMTLRIPVLQNLLKIIKIKIQIQLQKNSQQHLKIMKVKTKLIQQINKNKQMIQTQMFLIFQIAILAISIISLKVQHQRLQIKSKQILTTTKISKLKMLTNLKLKMKNNSLNMKKDLIHTQVKFLESQGFKHFVYNMKMQLAAIKEFTKLMIQMDLMMKLDSNTQELVKNLLNFGKKANKNPTFQNYVELMMKSQQFNKTKSIIKSKKRSLITQQITKQQQNLKNNEIKTKLKIIFSTTIKNKIKKTQQIKFIHFNNQTKYFLQIQIDFKIFYIQQIIQKITKIQINIYIHTQ
ncbi:hypothetical protein TTHERM_000011849 (macronuclear) [Tetrahymena thermophila SB210]|uniref:Uncharacterized protein n=1 Tax=Tetrahymena thermophila (strain SB210) TaxID=312017 RepID=W7XGZ2_TETTS|nr:hypothetical protein TTHERM_000011849 [Tetrahymena thermophila SB210]EWS76343.1 hypothetical protein TTHERM_000011849 [Tetrahymena thermophila SB210]|eukprot:XP_012651127.1 hypothetical protein TTHERM_000011849 [Tetrahymena thermophila SB210]